MAEREEEKKKKVWPRGRRPFERPKVESVVVKYAMGRGISPDDLLDRIEEREQKRPETPGSKKNENPE